MKSFSVTDIGKKRKLNQDFVYVSETQVGNLPNLFIVADGMGGHKAGDYASKCTVETMVPMFIIVMIYLGLMGSFGTIVILALLLLQIVLLIVTKARTPIHDILAHTVCVDFASQMIFDTPEALLEYKKRIHAEQVEAEKN